MEKLNVDFDFPLEKMQVLSDYIFKQMREGLEGNVSDLKMIPSFVTSLATGDEVGIVLSVEMGGSKVRVAKIHLLGGSRIEIEKEVIHPITDVHKHGTAEDLFGFVADCICEVEPESGLKVGFTFSYPCELSSCRKGTLIEWTKGYSAIGCIGKDPVELLLNELVKRGVYVQIVALCNDSVSTLVAHSYSNAKATIGVVLGSGTNAAYLEHVTNISKFHSATAAQNMIINMEWGNLGIENRAVLPISHLDELIDAASNNPGKQFLEKMMSGQFLGELSRLWMVHLRCTEGYLNQIPLTNLLFKERFCFDSTLCTTVLLDDSEELEEIGSILQSFGIKKSLMKERQILHDIVDTVITRSARLMATCIYAVLCHTGQLGVETSIGVEGSVFKFVPGYKRRVLRALEEFGLDNVDCSTAEDASCRGAALIAYSASSMYM